MAMNIFLRRGALAAAIAILAAPCGLALDVTAERMPVLVEVFTNKNCPNCPAAEKRLRGRATEDDGLLVVFEHVDYWDERAHSPDPWSLPEATERQYDYSNTLGRRPGEVFTPQPILDGHVVAKPPLVLSWNSALEQARASSVKKLLEVSAAPAGGMEVDMRHVDGLDARKHALWLLGVEKEEDSPVFHLTGMSTLAWNGTGSVHVGKGLVPRGSHVIAVLQQLGPGPIVALGMAPVSR